MIEVSPESSWRLPHFLSIADQVAALQQHYGLVDGDFTDVDLAEHLHSPEHTDILFFVGDDQYAEGDIGEVYSATTGFMLAAHGLGRTITHVPQTNLELARASITYPQGIHRVSLNLVANWEPEQGRSMDEVLASGERIAAIEVLAALAMANAQFFLAGNVQEVPKLESGILRDRGSERSHIFVYPKVRRGVVTKFMINGGETSRLNRSYAAPEIIEVS